MSESQLSQDDVSALFEQMQDGAAALATDAQTLQQAAATAQEIAADAGSADAKPATAFSPEVRRLLAIEVPIIVQLGMRRMAVGEVMRFSVGSIIEFHKSSNEELELLANNQSIGRGFAVKVGENFGIKLTSISTVKETIRKLGGTPATP